MLNVTYQQVQRYENGINKLNVENIQLIANILSMPVSYFFETDEKLIGVKESILPYSSAKEFKLLRFFRKIKNERTKNLIIQVTRLGAKADGTI